MYVCGVEKSILVWHGNGLNSSFAHCDTVSSGIISSSLSLSLSPRVSLALWLAPSWLRRRETLRGCEAVGMSSPMMDNVSSMMLTMSMDEIAEDSGSTGYRLKLPSSGVACDIRCCWRCHSWTRCNDIDVRSDRGDASSARLGDMKDEQEPVDMVDSDVVYRWVGQTCVFALVCVSLRCNDEDGVFVMVFLGLLKL